jgi:glycosyltransferase involved in cell wall biosynthesis
VRVAFNGRGLTDPLLRGFNRYTWCLLQGLQKIPGVELLVYTDHRSPFHEFFRSRLQARWIEIRSPKVLVWEQALLPWRLRQDRVDVFHAPCDGGLPAVRVCPYVVTYHGVPDLALADLVRSGELIGESRRYFDRSDGRSVSQLTRARSLAARRLNLMRADVVVTVSEFSAAELVKFAGVPRSKIAVTREAADETIREPISAAAAAAVLQKHNIPSCYLLYVGGYNAHKNVATLLQAYAAVKNTHPEVGLVMVGGADQSPDPKTLSQAGLHAGDVICLSRVTDEDLRAMYTNAAAFVTLSWHEGFCLPIVEAMCCAAPIVASRFGAIPEILGDGGLVVDPRNLDEVVGAIRSVLDSPAIQADLKRRAADRSRRYSWETTAAQTMSVYERLVAKRPLARVQEPAAQ